MYSPFHRRSFQSRLQIAEVFVGHDGPRLDLIIPFAAVLNTSSEIDNRTTRQD